MWGSGVEPRGLKVLTDYGKATGGARIVGSAWYVYVAEGR